MIKEKKKKNKKKIVIIIIAIILLIGASVSAYFLYQNYREEQKEIAAIEKKKKEDAKLLKDIKEHYNEFILVNKDTKLYKLESKKYNEIGYITKDTYLQIEQKGEVELSDKYFKLANLDYYILYSDVTPTEKIEFNDDYKNYIPFDFDIVTKNPTNFYLNDKLILTINESVTLQVFVNDDNYYYVEYDNRLLQVKKDEVETTVDSPKNIEVASKIGVLNYHFFYDPNLGESCNETICLKTSKFEEQLQYLKNNNFYTATMNDISLWMAKKIRLPKKTTVLTVDDGAMGTGKSNGNKLSPLLEKYDMHATLFLITAWWGIDDYLTPNVEVQSHGYNIHNVFGEATTKSKEFLLNDFKTSIEKLGGENTAFCYPFYAHNATVRAAVKESGFKIAFVGGNTKISQNTDPYQLYRYVVLNSITLNQFINMVN